MIVVEGEQPERFFNHFQSCYSSTGKTMQDLISFLDEEERSGLVFSGLDANDERVWIGTKKQWDEDGSDEL